MDKPKVSVVIPLYKPTLEVLEKVREMLKKQTIKAEIVENWNMPEAKSMNTGIRKAKGDIIVTLSGDCVPENEVWLEKLIAPLINDKNVVVTVSDLYLPEEYWKTYPFFIRLLIIPYRKIQRPRMDARACAYRKEDLEKTGLFDEDLKVIAIDLKLADKLETMGKFFYPNIKVFHLHKFPNFKKLINTFHNYSKANGMIVKEHGIKTNGFWQRFIRAVPFIGLASMLYRFPFEKYSYLFPAYLIFAAPAIHLVNVNGFWQGFLFKQKENSRNLEALNDKNKKILI